MFPAARDRFPDINLINAYPFLHRFTFDYSFIFNLCTSSLFFRCKRTSTLKSNITFNTRSTRQEFWLGAIVVRIQNASGLSFLIIKCTTCPAKLIPESVTIWFSPRYVSIINIRDKSRPSRYNISRSKPVRQGSCQACLASFREQATIRIGKSRGILEIPIKFPPRVHQDFSV